MQKVQQYTEVDDQGRTGKRGCCIMKYLQHWEKGFYQRYLWGTTTSRFGRLLNESAAGAKLVLSPLLPGTAEGRLRELRGDSSCCGGEGEFGADVWKPREQKKKNI